MNVDEEELEYLNHLMDNLLAIYKFVLENAPVLFDAVARIEKYCEKYSHSEPET
jgi:hypothetical protein